MRLFIELADESADRSLRVAVNHDRVGVFINKIFMLRGYNNLFTKYFFFAKSLTNTKPTFQNSKTPTESIQAAKALAELENMNFTPKAEISLDGRKERAEAMWRKYESLS